MLFIEQQRACVSVSGEECVPFTSGLLIGIGETREERLKGLLLLRSLQQQYGHIQELIIQNFRAKNGTPMAEAPEPSLEELQWTIAMARLVFGASMSIQAPPNLTPSLYGFAHYSVLVLLDAKWHIPKLPTSSSFRLLIWCKLKNQWCPTRYFPKIWTSVLNLSLL